MDGLERTALLLLSMGEQKAADVLRQMTQKQVEQIGKTMTEMQKINKDDMLKVMNDFIKESSKEETLKTDPNQYVRNMVVSAIGQEHAEPMLDKIIVEEAAEGLHVLRWMDAEAIAELLVDEHPQVKALVLSHLDEERSGSILETYSETEVGELLLRIASLSSVQPEMIDELNQVLEERIKNRKTNKIVPLGGTKLAANIMNFINPKREEEILNIMRERNEELSSKIEELMFVFDDLVYADKRSIQNLLREVPSNVLQIAMRGADEEIKALFFANMSKRAAMMLRENMKTQGPVKVSEVEEAQNEVLGIANKLREEDQFRLERGAGAGSDML